MPFVIKWQRIIRLCTVQSFGYILAKWKTSIVFKKQSLYTEISLFVFSPRVRQKRSITLRSVNNKLQYSKQPLSNKYFYKNIVISFNIIGLSVQCHKYNCLVKHFLFFFAFGINTVFSIFDFAFCCLKPPKINLKQQCRVAMTKTMSTVCISMIWMIQRGILC